MSGMIPGVGVPHRRRMNHRENSVHDDPFFNGERFSDSSVELTETALRARERLERKLSSCLVISPRTSSLREKSPKGNTGNKKWGSSKLMSITRSLKFTKDDGSVRSVCCCCC